MTDPNFTRKTQIYILLAVLVLFIPAAVLIPLHYLVEVLTAMAASLGVGVVFVYGRGLVHGFRQNKLGAGHLLVLGILLAWGAVVTRVVWTWFVRLSDQPELMYDHWIVALVLWLLVVAAGFHITAQNAIEFEIPRHNWVWMGLLASAGVFIGLVVLRLTVM